MTARRRTASTGAWASSSARRTCTSGGPRWNLIRRSRTRFPGKTVRPSPPLLSPSVIRTQPHHGGWLEVVCGPMFSGKSEELIRRLRRAEIAGQRALIVKPLIDDRYDLGHVVSHAGGTMRAVTAQSSSDAQRLARGYDAVGIAEAQLFDDGV